MSTSVPTWQTELSQAISDIPTLCEYLHLDPLQIHIANLDTFPLRVPQNFLARIEKNNPNDPLLLQIITPAAKLQPAEDFSADPLQEKTFNPVPGLLHKYPNRVLLTLTSACAIHCRYCFRQHFDYAENNPGKKGWEKAFAYLRDHPEITEVILSGGDPLSVDDDYLEWFMHSISAIKSIDTLRFHTRFPIVIPQRITPKLIQLLQNSCLKIVMVLHSNHPNEINLEVMQMCHLLKTADITLLNQSVLLKSVNDNAFILKQLSEKLFAAGVLPYYLHTLDRVQGAENYDLAAREIQTIYAKLQTLLPGYLVPKLASEIPHKLHKTLITETA